MAREIDWSKPLSDEDRTWAEQRLDMPSGSNGLTIGQQIARNDEEHGKAAKDARMSRSERMDVLRSGIAESQNELARLEQEQIEEDNENRARAGSLGEQAAGLGFTDNTPVNGEKPEGAPEPSDDYDDTKKWTVQSLQAEIDRRNEDGAELRRTGTRSELVERLRADDEELQKSEGA